MATMPCFTSSTRRARLPSELLEAAQSRVSVLGQDRSHLQQLLPPNQEMMPARCS